MQSIIIDNDLYITEESFFEIDAKDKKAYDIYYNEIKYYPILTKEEELALFIKWKKHKDYTAKERLIKCNLRYVCKVALNAYNKAQYVNLKLEDIVQEGNIGLIVAIDKFDYTKGYRFLTYADAWIKQHIYRAVYNKERLIKVPVHVEQDFTKIKSAYTFLSKYSKKKITTENLASTSGLTEKRVKSALNYIKTHVYFDAPLKDNSSKQEGGKKTIGDTIIDNATADLMEMIIEEGMQSEKYKFLDNLNYVERNIILQKYNPHGKIVTDEELALINNMKVEDVKKNLNRATRKLRQNQKRPLY